MITGWRERYRDTKVGRATGVSLMLLLACGYYLYQFSRANENTRQLEVLHQQQQTLEQLQAHLSPAALSSSQLADSLHQSAGTWGIAIDKITGEEDEAELTLADVPFEHLLQWLAALQREHGVRVLKLDVERREQPDGVIRVNQLRLTIQPVI